MKTFEQKSIRINAKWREEYESKVTAQKKENTKIDEDKQTIQKLMDYFISKNKIEVSADIDLLQILEKIKKKYKKYAEKS